MKKNSIKIRVLVVSALLVSFGCVANGNARKSGSLASEATSDQVQHGFWKNPNVNYISTGWPNDSENLRIDHVPNLENAFIDIAPTDRKDLLVIGELGSDGGERNLPAFTEDEFPVLEGPYLGQKPPGLTPEVFAPGIVSTEHHEGGGLFSPDMTEFYFSRKNTQSGKKSRLVFKSKNNRWYEEPGVYGDLSFDGKTMFYLNQYRERTDDGWSELKSLGSAFEDIEIMRLTTSSKGTYVFDEFPKDGKGNIRYSRLIIGQREAPKSFNKEINTGKNNVHPFIAPDESYILWDSEREGGYGGSDLYISFRQEDGSWGVAINLGDKVNTSTSQRGAYVTADGRHLFFNSPASSGNGDIFWVNAQIIETLRPKL